MKPTLGRTVIYRLTDDDLKKQTGNKKTASQARPGKMVAVPNGPVAPALICAVAEDCSVNLRVFCDSGAILHVRGVWCGLLPGEWSPIEPA